MSGPRRACSEKYLMGKIGPPPPPMTEERWLECKDPQDCTTFLSDKTSERKLRLFAVACCRRIGHILIAKEQFDAIELGERFAEGEANQEEVDEFQQWAHANYTLDLPSAVIDANAAVYQPCHRAETFDGSFSAYFASGSASTAMYHYLNSLQAVPDEPFSLDKVEGEKAVQMLLLRDIVGNPFRPIAFDPSWRTSTTQALACSMYASRDFSAAPVLADSLEEAGCHDPAILEHLRGENVHVRGCWVVDAVLGKE